MYGYVDRFEEDLVVVSFEELEMTVDLPRCLFPEELHEGDYVTFNIAVDPEKTAEAYEEARRLLEM